MNTEQKELIEGCLQKKAWAYKKLYRQYHPFLLGICLRYARDKSEAEDILLKGLMNIFSKIGLYSFKGSFEAWLRRSMVNTAINHYRKYRRDRQMLDIEEFETELVYDGNQISNMTEKEILSIIQQLPPGYSLVFNLYVFEGLTHAEIAEELGISVSTSKTQLKKARNWLKINLNESKQ